MSIPAQDPFRSFEGIDKLQNQTYISQTVGKPKVVSPVPLHHPVLITPFEQCMYDVYLKTCTSLTHCQIFSSLHILQRGTAVQAISN